MMDYYIQTCARQAISNRQHAKDKSYQYSTRLMFDKCAARWEQALINLANKLIASASNG